MYLGKKRYIGHPKTINNQQGKCVKILFLVGNENKVPSVFTQYLKQLSCYFTQIHKNWYIKLILPVE